MSYVSPAKKSLEIFDTKDTSKVPYLLFVFAIWNCNSWVAFGIQINNEPIYFSNIPGSILFTIFITVALYYHPFKKANRILLLIILYTLDIAYLYICFYYISSKVNGMLCVVANVLMYLTPIFQIYKVIKTNDNEYVDFWIASAFLMNALSWLTYSILTNIINLFIPTFIGTFVSLAQVIVWQMYNNKKIILTKEKGISGYTTDATDEKDILNSNRKDIKNHNINIKYDSLPQDDIERK